MYIKLKPIPTSPVGIHVVNFLIYLETVCIKWLFIEFCFYSVLTVQKEIEEKV